MILNKEKTKEQLINDLATLRQKITGLEQKKAECKWTEAELQRRNRELALLNRVITASAASLDLKTILETTCRELALAFDVPQSTAFLLNEEQTEVVVVAEYLSTGSTRPAALRKVMPVAGNPIALYLITHKAPLVIKDKKHDPRLTFARDFLRSHGSGSLLIVPLVIEEEIVGCLDLDAAEPRDFSPEEVDLACNVARQIAGALGRIRLAEAHQQLIEQYYHAQKMEAMGQLVGGISHDFKNLLMAINGFAELIQCRSELTEDQQEMVGHILSAGQRAADLIHRLLVFSYKQTIEPQVLTLNILVANLHKMLRRIINENIRIETVLAANLWPVKADPAQLEQVILNLAINARDAMPNGGQLTIATTNVVLDEAYTHRHFNVQPGAYVLLTVSDTGVGMSAETQAHIFEPFFTTKARGYGSGLGLATVYGIVKQNQGDIWVYSEAGQGTTFKIYLPRAEAAALPPTHDEAIADKPRGNETILLIEDDARVRELTQTVLAEQGYTVLAAEDGQAALQVAADHPSPIHLLLSDVIMPGMSGKDIAGQLSRMYPDLKILFMSGHSDDTLAHFGVLEPDVAFLPKPFGPFVLANKVRAVLDEA
jgi:signal transduction histidine kinase